MSIACLIRKIVDTRYSILIFSWIVYRMFYDAKYRIRFGILYLLLLFIWMYAFLECSASGNLFARVAEGIIINSVIAFVAVVVIQYL